MWVVVVVVVFDEEGGLVSGLRRCLGMVWWIGSGMGIWEAVGLL